MKNELEEKSKSVDILSQENQRLNLHIQQQQSALSKSETLKSLQLSNSSAGRNNGSSVHLVKELSTKNAELKEKYKRLIDMYTHSQLREKKLKFFFFLMQNKGYPVQQIF